MCHAEFASLDQAKIELMDLNGNYRVVDDICKYCYKTITAEQKLALLKKILMKETQEVQDGLKKKLITVPNTSMGKQLKAWAQKGEIPIKPELIRVQGEIRQEDKLKPEILETINIKFLRKLIDEQNMKANSLSQRNARAHVAGKTIELIQQQTSEEKKETNLVKLNTNNVIKDLGLGDNSSALQALHRNSIESSDRKKKRSKSPKTSYSPPQNKNRLGISQLSSASSMYEDFRHKKSYSVKQLISRHKKKYKGLNMFDPVIPRIISGAMEFPQKAPMVQKSIKKYPQFAKKERNSIATPPTKTDRDTLASETTPRKETKETQASDRDIRVGKEMATQIDESSIVVSANNASRIEQEVEIGVSLDTQRAFNKAGSTARAGQFKGQKKAKWDFSVLDLPQLTGKQSDKILIASQRAKLRRSVNKIAIKADKSPKTNINKTKTDFSQNERNLANFTQEEHSSGVDESEPNAWEQRNDKNLQIGNRELIYMPKSHRQLNLVPHRTSNFNHFPADIQTERPSSKISKTRNSQRPSYTNVNQTEEISFKKQMVARRGRITVEKHLNMSEQKYVPRYKNSNPYSLKQQGSRQKESQQSDVNINREFTQLASMPSMPTMLRQSIDSLPDPIQLVSEVRMKDNKKKTRNLISSSTDNHMIQTNEDQAFQPSIAAFPAYEDSGTNNSQREIKLSLDPRTVSVSHNQYVGKSNSLSTMAQGTDYDKKRLSLHTLQGVPKKMNLIRSRANQYIHEPAFPGSGRRVRVIRNSEDLKEFLQDEYKKKLRKRASGLPCDVHVSTQPEELLEETEVIYNVNTTNPIPTVGINRNEGSSGFTRIQAAHSKAFNDSQETIDSKQDTKEMINKFVTYSEQIENQMNKPFFPNSSEDKTKQGRSVAYSQQKIQLIQQTQNPSGLSPLGQTAMHGTTPTRSIPGSVESTRFALQPSYERKNELYLGQEEPNMIRSIQKSRPESMPSLEYQDQTPKKKARQALVISSGQNSANQTLLREGSAPIGQQKKSKDKKKQKKYKSSQPQVQILVNSNQSKSSKHFKGLCERPGSKGAGVLPLTEMVLRPVTPGIISSPMALPSTNTKVKPKSKESKFVVNVSSPVPYKNLPNEDQNNTKLVSSQSKTDSQIQRVYSTSRSVSPEKPEFESSIKKINQFTDDGVPVLVDHLQLKEVVSGQEEKKADESVTTPKFIHKKKGKRAGTKSSPQEVKNDMPYDSLQN